MVRTERVVLAMVDPYTRQTAESRRWRTWGRTTGAWYLLDATLCRTNHGKRGLVRDRQGYNSRVRTEVAGVLCLTVVGAPRLGLPNDRERRGVVRPGA